MIATEHNIQLPFTTSHAFIIGINDYEHISPLSSAVNDAKALARQLKEEHGYQVYDQLLNKKATKAALVQFLKEEMPQIVGADDRVLFYFAGHGIALDSDDNPKGYLVPVDAQPEDPSSLIPMNLLHDAFTSLPCQHGLLIMDCCFAGAFKWSTGFRDVVFDLPAIIYEERFYQYARDPAWQVITSSASDQKAVDILSNRTLGMRNESGAKHSPFALALMDGLQGEGDTIPKDREDGVITATELYTYLRNRVEDETTLQGKRQSPSMFSLSKHDKGQYIFMNPRHPLNLPPIPKRNPFMGLKSYNEEDQLLFYGRDRVITALDELIAKVPFVVVSGMSGTGKSSVIKAGLLPLLRKKEWNILPVIRPGKNPIQSLNTDLSDLEHQLNTTHPSVLIIDQYEELITQCLNPEERIAFEKQLVDWLNTYPLLHIIISVRSDFEPQFEEAALAPWWQQGRYVVPAFSQDELREVIIKPTIQEVLFFDPDTLVDKLVDAVNQAPGALPLLSFTLSELYHAYLNSGRTNRAFTLEDYQELGGVIGALRTRANMIYDELDETHQDSMRKLMLRMVSLEGGELASRRVSNQDLIFKDSTETQNIQEVAQQLVAARLIATGRDEQGNTYYEPAHDALVRAWSRLWEWIKSQGEGKLSLMYKLSLAVVDYQAHKKEGKAKDYLWDNDPRLNLLYADFQSTDHSFNAAEESFLEASMQLRKHNTRRRRILVAGAIVILLAISGVAVWQFFEAKSQAELANLKTEEAEKQAARADKEAYNAKVQADSALTSQRRAEISDSVARKDRDFAQQQQIIAEVNLRKVTEANRMLFGDLIQNIDSDIRQLQYEEALDKAMVAASFNVNEQLTIHKFSEIVFWYNEAGDMKRARAGLDSMITTFPAKLPMKEPIQNISSLSIRKLLEDIDKDHYAFLMRRYYPFMIEIKGGTFDLGCDTDKYEHCRDRSNLVRGVSVSDYAIAETETTWWQIALFRIVTKSNHAKAPDPRLGERGDYPVNKISWYEAIDYANWVSIRLGYEKAYSKPNGEVIWDQEAYGFHLPTEVQWEYAAKTDDNHVFAGTSNQDSLGFYCYYKDSYGNRNNAMPVKSFLPNKWGLYDMSGNVWEWCWDWYEERHPTVIKKDYTGPIRQNENKKGRLLKGGGYRHGAKLANVADRNDRAPESNHVADEGFRLARKSK